MLRFGHVYEFWGVWMGKKTNYSVERHMGYMEEFLFKERKAEVIFKWNNNKKYSKFASTSFFNDSDLEKFHEDVTVTMKKNRA